MKLDTQVKLEAIRTAVDAAADRHARRVAGTAQKVASKAIGGARLVAFGAGLGARYVAGFARGLRSPQAALPNA